jgi:hypothetical protein
MAHQSTRAFTYVNDRSNELQSLGKEPGQKTLQRDFGLNRNASALTDRADTHIPKVGVPGLLCTLHDYCRQQPRNTRY